MMLTFEHIYPMVAHFPIAFIFAGFVTQFVYLFFMKHRIFPEAENWLLKAGTLSAIATYSIRLF